MSSNGWSSRSISRSRHAHRRGEHRRSVAGLEGAMSLITARSGWRASRQRDPRRGSGALLAWDRADLDLGAGREGALAGRDRPPGIGAGELADRACAAPGRASASGSAGSAAPASEGASVTSTQSSTPGGDDQSRSSGAERVRAVAASRRMAASSGAANSSKITAGASGYPGRPMTGAIPPDPVRRGPAWRGRAAPGGRDGRATPATATPPTWASTARGVVAAPPARPGDDEHQVGVSGAARRISAASVSGSSGCTALTTGTAPSLPASRGEHERVGVE